jgi:hypothetical protein
MSMDEWIREESLKYAEEQFAYYEREHGDEKWWRELKDNLKTKGIKDFIYEFTRRCLAQDLGPKDFDLEEALKSATKYTSVETAIKELEEKHLFPPPPPLERSVERFEKEKEKALMMEAQQMLKRLEEEPELEKIIKEKRKWRDYKGELEKTKKQIGELQKMLEEEKKKAMEAEKKWRETMEELQSWRSIVNVLAGKIWREWVRKPEKPKTDYYALLNLISFFVDECRKRSLDPSAIKIEEKIKHYLSPEENRKIILDEIEKYKTIPIEEIKKLEAEREEWKRKAEEAEKRYVEEKRKEEEALKPPKPVLGDREYKVLLKEFIDQVGDKVILSKELMDALQRVFKLEWEVNKIAYLDFREAEDYVRSLAEKWAKTVEGELREYKGIIPKVTAETEKKIALDYEKLAREVARRMEKYMPRYEYVAPGFIPPIPSEPIPKKPKSEWRGPFPRPLTGEEIDIFKEHYERTLWERGLNPYERRNQEIFAAFSEAWHQSWEQVLERFKLIIKCALEGLPIPKFPPPELIFEEIPKEPVIHFTDKDSDKPIDEQAKSLEELTEYIKEEAREVVPPEEREKIDRLTPEDVRRILEEEYAKGEKCHTRFKPLLKKKNYLWNILRLKDLEEDAKWSTLLGLWEGTKSLKDLVDYAKSVHGLRVTEDDVKKWIREELEKPSEKAHTRIRLYRWKAEELIK